jgi:hypothetical protein
LCTSASPCWGCWRPFHALGNWWAGLEQRNPEEIARAEQEEQQFLVEINRLMDRLSAVEGQFMQVRKTGRRRFQ